MLGRINSQKGKDLDNINGIIKEYKIASGENISSGDFVKFINTYDLLNQKDIYSASSIKKPDAIDLGNNKYFITYSNSTTRYAFVCDLNDNEVTCGTKIEITSSDTYNLVLIDKSKILMTIYEGNNLSVQIINISDLVISLSEKTNLTTILYCCKISTVLMPNNKVFISYSVDERNSNWAIYGMLCEINSQAISTIVAPKKLGNQSNVKSNNTRVAALCLSEEKVFIAYNREKSTDNIVIRSLLCNVSETDITIIDEKDLSGSFSGYNIEAFKIKNKIYVLHEAYQSVSGNTYSNPSIRCKICEINSNTIEEKRSSELFGNFSIIGFKNLKNKLLVLLETGGSTSNIKTFIIGDNQNHFFTEEIFDWSSNGIIYSSSDMFKNVLFNNTNLLFLYTLNNGVNTTIKSFTLDYEDYVSKVTDIDEDEIKGIAVSSVDSTNNISIIVPNSTN